MATTMESLRIKQERLVSNQAPRLPVCLLADSSSSMAGEKIDQLNRGIRAFINAVQEDATACASVELSTITIGGKKPEVLFEFTPVDELDMPVLEINGITPLAQAIKQGVELLDERKNELKTFGVPQYKPWVIIISDGLSTDDPEQDRESSQLLRQKIDNGDVLVVAVAVGENEDQKTQAIEGLQCFAPKNTYLLDGVKFEEFFIFLSQSTQSRTNLNPGDAFDIDFSQTDSVAKIEDPLNM